MARSFDNPFTPVAGKVPLYLPGCEAIIDDVEAALSGAGNAPAIISLLVGARGTGGTALLSYFADAAEANAWVTARVVDARRYGRHRRQEHSRGLLEFCLPGIKDYFLERLAEEREA